MSETFDGRVVNESNSVRRLKVLLADDDLVNQRIVLELLQQRGHHVVVANIGEEVTTTLEASSFDVVLVDVRLAEMNGFAAVAAIRAHEHSTARHIPIIAMVVTSIEGERERCSVAGMDGCLAKPVAADELERVVDRVVSLSSKSDTEMQDAADSSGEVAKVIDLAVASSQIPGGDAGLREMAQLLIDECPRMMTSIRQALKTGDFKGVQRGAHTLKGSADVFGAARVVAAARRVEQAARDGEFERMPEILPELDRQVSRLQAALRTLLNNDWEAD